MAHGLKRLVASVVLFSTLFAVPFRVFAFDPVSGPMPTPPDASSGSQQVPLPKDLPTPPAQDAPQKIDAPDIQPGDHDNTPSDDTVKTPVSGSGSSETYTDPTVGITPAVLFSSQKDPNGAFTYSYPITIPKGRGNAQPEVSLNYNSSNKEKDSVVGYGWSLSIPSISRENYDGVDVMYSETHFTSSRGGRLVSVSLSDATHGTYLLESSKGPVETYVYNADGSWTVTTPDGTKYLYGTSTASQQYDSASTSHVFRWMLQEILDKNGNTVVYTYTQDQGQIYPATMTYSGNGSVAGTYVVTFTNESRSDAFSSYATGFHVVTGYRISAIAVTQGTSTVHSYVLRYSAANYGPRSMLAGVTETAYGSDGLATTLPEEAFTYSTSLTPSWSKVGTSTTLPLSFLSSAQGGDLGCRVMNVNGDAFSDIVCSNAGSSTTTSNAVYINNANNTGWTQNTAYSVPVQFVSGLTGGDNGVRAFDVNGDGYDDIVQSLAYSGTTSYTSTQNVWINNKNGTGWALTSWSIPVYFTTMTSGFSGWSTRTDGIDFGDVNGDGLVDLVEADAIIGAHGVYTNTGSGWVADTTFSVASFDFRSSRCVADSGDMGMRFADVNGDGLDDIVEGFTINNSYCSSTSSKVYINTGNGSWSLDTAYTFPTNFVVTNGYDNGARMNDNNGDGFPDVLQAGSYNSTTTNTTNLNPGYGQNWAAATSSIPKYFTMDNGHSYPTDSGLRQGDFDGDGFSDLLYGTYTTANNEVDVNTATASDLLTGMTFHTGSSATIAYKAASEDETSAPLPVQVVSSVTMNDGLGSTSAVSYRYAGGSYYWLDAQHRQFAGFQSIVATDSLSETTTTYFHQGNSSDSSSSEPTDSKARIGLPYRVDVKDSSGVLRRTSLTRFDETTLATGAYFISLGSEVVMTYDTDGSTHSDTAIAHTYAQPNASAAPYFYGETVKSEYGTVIASSDGSSTDSGTDTRVTTTTYAVDTAGAVNGLPSQVTVTDSSGTTVAQKKYSYDSLSAGLVSTGNITTEQQWISGSTYASTTYTYDAYGNVLTTTAPNGGVTTTVYETTASQYPSTVTDALSHQTTFSYSLAFGKPTSMTNPNGSIVTTVYDGLGRPTSETQSSDASATTMVTTKTWSYSDALSPRSVTAREYLSATVYKETITFIDGFGRTVEVKTLSASGSGYNESQTTYDALGRVSSTTLPQATTLSTYESTAVSSSLAQTFSYDVLSRVTSVVDALGTTSTSYSGLMKTVTDALSKQKSYTTDGLGRLTSVVENISGTAYTTSYTYNATDALTGVTDSMANVRSFTYDGRNLRLTAQDLHASTDTTFGTWTFTYDTSGNLSTSVSPNAITTTNTYDTLNRLLTEDASSTTGTDVTYGYDSCTNGTGLLCMTSVNGGVSTANVYTANSRLSSETKTISSVAYTTTTTYDYAGNPLTITYPDTTVVRNTYNAIGALATVEKKASADAAYVTVTSAFSYGPDGQLTSQTNANGTVTTNTYDSAKRYRLTRRVTTGFTAASTTTSVPTTVTFYSSVGDGYTYKSNASWDTAHDATTGTAVSGTGTTATVGTSKSTTSYYVYRALLPFDTSSLPDDATITAATLKTYVSSRTNNDNDGDDFLTVVQSTQTSATALSTADYGKTGATNNPTEGVDATGRKDITSISASAWLTFTLNATGQGFISKTSSSMLALREGHDVIDSSFTSSSTTGTQSDTVAFRTSEYTGTTYDPVLSVTYTTSSTTPSSSTNLQDLSYTYDAVGNILTIVDASNETTAKTTTYAYDDLSRLTSEAVTGSANSDNTTITYAYDALGNITSRSDKGTYTYAGNAGTSYANPHAVTSILKTDGTTQTFTYDTNGNLTSDGTTTYTWDYKNRLTGSAIVSSSSSTTTTTATFAPTTGDGLVYNGSSSTWATTHDATSGSYASATSTQVMAQVGKDSSGTAPYNIVRALFPFDTSSIPATSTITAASLSVYVYGKGDQIVDAYDYATVVQSTQTSSTTISTGDYSKVGTATSPTEGIATTERKDLATISTGAYLTFTLNATGQGFITKAGVTKLGVREGHDTASVSTGVTAGKYNYLNMYSGEQTGTSQDPYLSVTYTTSSSSSSTTNPVTYTYDAFDARIIKSATTSSTSTTTTSVYPTSNYSVDGSTTTVYLSGPSGSSLASVLNTGTTSSVLSTIHSDHLGSTAVLSDTSGIMTELLDYHGYGNSRLTSGTATAKKTFIGQYTDSETSLSYLNARYYDSARGQFLSEDSVFLGMGTGNKKAQLALLDPQLQNSYGYARDNPIALKDADGNWPQWMSLGSLASAVNAVYNVITLGAGNRAEEMGRNGATVGGVAHVVGGVAFGTVSVSFGALDVEIAAGEFAIDVGRWMSTRQGLIGRSGNIIPTILRKELPETTQASLQIYEDNGWKKIQGLQRKVYHNNEGILPGGQTYHEFDINPKTGLTRDTQRLFRGDQNGDTYHTDTHMGKIPGTVVSKIK